MAGLSFDPNLSSSSSLPGHIPPSAAFEAIGARPRQALRRSTKQASYELANHAKAYLEGGKVASGYEFLLSLLAAGTSVSTPAQPHLGILAPPAYIAFASSLVADPVYTTQARSPDSLRGSDAALRYLQSIHTTIDGPAYSIIRKAFAFPEERLRRRTTGYRSTASPSPGGSGGDIERLIGPAANEKSLWHCAEDFWHIVGWAFNCSVIHKKRWGRWKLWLLVMLDFLETDWHVCVQESKETVDPVPAIQTSLLWRYITGDNSSISRSVRRRIVKAILATATPESQHNYPEVWPREALALKKKQRKNGSLDQLDVEAARPTDCNSDEEMQDWLAQPDSQDELAASESDERSYSVHDASERLGGEDAIEIRQRFIALLARVAEALPKQFTTPSDFFDNILEDVRLLPIAIFHTLISTLALQGPLKIAFYANLLLPLVSGSVPDYFRFHAAPDHLETRFLPMKATTQSFVANAKVSLILEQIFIYMMTQDTIVPTTKMRIAMEDGIKARQSVYGTGRGKKVNAGEESQAKGLMQASSNRLLGLLEILEMEASKPAQPTTVTALPPVLSFTSGSSLSTPPETGSGVED